MAEPRSFPHVCPCCKKKYVALCLRAWTQHAKSNRHQEGLLLMSIEDGVPVVDVESEGQSSAGEEEGSSIESCLMDKANDTYGSVKARRAKSKSILGPRTRWPNRSMAIPPHKTAFA